MLVTSTLENITKLALNQVLYALLAAPKYDYDCSCTMLSLVSKPVRLNLLVLLNTSQWCAPARKAKSTLGWIGRRISRSLRAVIFAFFLALQ